MNENAAGVQGKVDVVVAAGANVPSVSMPMHSRRLGEEGTTGCGIRRSVGQGGM